MTKTFSYIKYNEESVAASERCKTLCEELEVEIKKMGAGRYQSLAVTHLEITFMMIGKAIRDRQLLSEPQAEHIPERNNE